MSRLALACLPAALLAACGGAPPAEEPAASAPAALTALTALTPAESLGKKVFFDANLSEPRGQSCASCHGPQVGYTGPSWLVNATTAVYPGAVHGRFGNRKPPTAAYAGAAPILHQADGRWVGGMFWDGRATGFTLGDPLAEQAQGPFLNPLEQNLPTPQEACSRIAGSAYAALLAEVCDAGPATCLDPALAQRAYECIARAVAAFERSREVSPFSSRWDAWAAGRLQLSPLEERGRLLFEGKGRCAACHVPPLFTDFSYDNLGVPRNPFNPFYREPEWNPLGRDWVDEGLGGYLRAAGYPAAIYEAELGKVKVPTLRNVAKRPSPLFAKAYAHNGYFRSLRAVVHFYNTRDVLRPCHSVSWVLPGVTCWPVPEVAATVNRTELGNLGLTLIEEEALVAFLHTLSDGCGD